MMAHSAHDPYWQAGVRREVLDHPSAAPAIEHECSRCHMPMAHVTQVAAGVTGQVFANLPAGGTSSVPHPRCGRRVLHRVPPDPEGQAGYTRELHGAFCHRYDHTRRSALHLRAVHHRAGPAPADALGHDVPADGGRSHPVLGDVRDMPHAVHADARRCGRADRDAARAGALPGVATQRLPDHDELSGLSHAGRAGTRADLEHAW